MRRLPATARLPAAAPGAGTGTERRSTNGLTAGNRYSRHKKWGGAAARTNERHRPLHALSPISNGVRDTPSPHKHDEGWRGLGCAPARTEEQAGARSVKGQAAFPRAAQPPDTGPLRVHDAGTVTAPRKEKGTRVPWIPVNGMPGQLPDLPVTRCW
jgi:hypothetical protein